MHLVRVGVAAALALALTAILLVTALPATGASVGPVPGRSGATGGSADWPTYLHDTARSSSNRVDRALSPTTAANLSVRWQFSTGKPVAASPTLVDGTLFIGSWDGKEYALNATTGALRWSTFLGTTSTARCGPTVYGVTSSATWANGMLYVGGGAADWYALNATTGAIVGNLSVGNSSAYYNWASPLVVGGHAYLGLSSVCDKPLIRGGLLKVDLSLAKVVRSFYTVPTTQVGASVWGSPTYSPGTARTGPEVFVATGNGNTSVGKFGNSLVELNASTLAVLGHWQVPKGQHGLDSDFGTTPTLVSGPNGRPLVVAGNKNGVVYAFDRRDVSAGPVWSDPIAVGGPCPQCGNGTISSGAYDGRLLYLAGGERQIGTTSFRGSVEAVDPGNGTAVWTEGLQGVVLPAVAAGDGLVVVGAGDNVSVLNASSGALVYEYRTGGPILGAPILAGGCIFVGSADHNVYAFGLASSSCGSPVTVGGGKLPPGLGPEPSSPLVARRVGR